MTENPLGYEKISKLLKNFAVPSIIDRFLICFFKSLGIKSILAILFALNMQSVCRLGA